jgi:hypothetical protein
MHVECALFKLRRNTRSFCLQRRSLADTKNTPVFCSALQTSASSDVLSQSQQLLSLEITKLKVIKRMIKRLNEAAGTGYFDFVRRAVDLPARRTYPAGV